MALAIAVPQLGGLASAQPAGAQVKVYDSDGDGIPDGNPFEGVEDLGGAEVYDANGDGVPDDDHYCDQDDDPADCYYMPRTAASGSNPAAQTSGQARKA